jgi:hypothetical protein
MRTLYLHIGAHKTGTTYLQSALHLNQAALASQGIDTLTDLAVWGQGHHNVAFSYLGWGLRDESRDRDSYRRMICARIKHSPLPSVVLSSEFFELFDDAAILRLRCDLAPVRTVLIYWIRNQPRYLESYYLESHKQGLSEPFQTWLDRRLQTGLGDFCRVVERWSTVLGVDARPVVIYDNLSLAGINIFELFVRDHLQLGSGHACRLPAAALINPSIDCRLLWLLRELNRVHNRPESHAAGISADYLRLRQRLERAYHGNRALSPNACRASVLDAEIASGIEHHYADSNARFLRCFGADIRNPTGEGRLFPAPRLNLPGPDPQGGVQATDIPILRELLRRVLAGE